MLEVFSLLFLTVISEIYVLPIQALTVLFPVLVYCAARKSAKSKTAKSGNGLTSSDAMKLPGTASLVLFGLYIAFKHVSPNILNILIDAYVVLASLLPLSELFASILSLVAPRSACFPMYKFSSFLVSFIFEKDVLIITPLLTMCAGMSTILLAFYFRTRDARLNNLIALALALSALDSMEVTSFFVSMLLMWGLFVYDIFWVYGTDVMLTVAKKLNAPLKLLFRTIDDNGDKKYSLLGLGDIVLPGVHVMLMNSFDKSSKEEKSSVYFWFSIVSYIVGMIVCGIVLTVTKKGQPALFFLVPALTLGSILPAILRGELKKLFLYEENQI